MVHRKSRGGTGALNLSFSHDEISWYRGKSQEKITTITSISEGFYHRAIFNCIAGALQSEWFSEHGLLTQTGRLYKIRHFFGWLQSEGYTIDDENKYLPLKDYAKYNTQLNSTNENARSVRLILKIGLTSESLSVREYQYLSRLIKVKLDVPFVTPRGYTLTDWFSAPQLKNLLTEDEILSLESPKKLILSMKVTIAATLLFLHLCRTQWTGSDIAPQSGLRRKYNWHFDWNRSQMQQYARFDDSGRPCDFLSELMIIDFINPAVKAQAQQDLPEKILSSYKLSSVDGGKRLNTWWMPNFFHPSFINAHSAVEERLLSWLIACEAVQPWCIHKLTKRNFIAERTQGGGLKMMQIKYFKGRSGTLKETGFMPGDALWTKMVDLYVTHSPDDGPVFKTAVQSPLKTVTMHDSSTCNNEISLMRCIWSLDSFQALLSDELAKHNASNIFHRSMMMIYKYLNENIDTVRSDPSFPWLIFRLSHIKTSAVHAGSDTYREGDLINHHSHTSLTEKISYLTDANKDWVNRLGRITRSILNDLEKAAYRPFTGEILKEIHQREVRTRIVGHASVNNLVLPSASEIHTNLNHEGREIVIHDCIDTALIFLHYLSETEKYFPILVERRPDFVEKTLLVNVEWISRILPRMRCTYDAKKQYQRLKNHLPSLFDHLLESIV